MKFRVWHIPQVPGKAFYVEVESFEQGEKLCEILANYDVFQFENNIKPDYANTNGVEYLNDQSDEWESIDRELLSELEQTVGS